MSGCWIQTHTGKRFDLLEPNPDDVDIRDIAHALSNVARFGGHTLDFYSVAQHSVNVERVLVVDIDGAWAEIRRARLLALLHDATESYIGDMVSPLKEHMPAFREIESQLWAAISTHFFGEPVELPHAVKKADLVMLMTERRDLLGPPVASWGSYLESIAPDPAFVAPWSPAKAEGLFLRRFSELTA